MILGVWKRYECPPDQVFWQDRKTTNSPWWLLGFAQAERSKGPNRYQVCILHRLHLLKRVRYGLQHRLAYTKDPKLAPWSMFSRLFLPWASGQRGLTTFIWAFPTPIKSSSSQVSSAASHHIPNVMTGLRTYSTWGLSLFLCSLFTYILSLLQGLEAGQNSPKQRTGRGCHKGSWASD